MFNDNVSQIKTQLVWFFTLFFFALKWHISVFACFYFFDFLYSLEYYGKYRGTNYRLLHKSWNLQKKLKWVCFAACLLFFFLLKRVRSQNSLKTCFTCGPNPLPYFVLSAFWMLSTQLNTTIYSSTLLKNNLKELVLYLSILYFSTLTSQLLLLLLLTSYFAD